MGDPVGPFLTDEQRCERCEGEGSYSEVAPCTTFDLECACNGPRVLVDPCPDCGGDGLTDAGRRVLEGERDA